MTIRTILLLLVVLATPWVPARAASDQETIVFGQSAALTGPARELGIGMRLGLLAAFSEVNRKGGIHGYRLQLESLDDRYEPEAAIANTRSLIEEHKVFALIGAVGTPTSKSAQPVATEAGVPYIAPFTGAEFLRDAKKRPNVVNVRASYYQETEEMVVRLNEDLGINRISIFYQNDSFGQAGLNGLRQAVNRHGLTLIEEVYYTRNTEAVKIALLDLRRANAEAVVIVGAYKPAATMIRWARRLNFNPYFINISFIGSAALAKALGPDGTGVYVTQVVPFPRDTTLPIVAQYQEALQAINTSSKPSFVSLEGYLAGRIAIEGLQLAGPAPTRKGFLQALVRAGDMDLGGFRLRYGVDDNQGSDRVYLTRIDDKGRFQAVDKMSLP
ncbi:MAG: ABC transporter substrate-binding protein [Nitrospira sp.]|nr:ABC transporter substrate-binding protein [Nitrospira sp.]MCY4132655.1 ABC transporter substrate-binding protein [Nitrospira sp.]